MAPEISVDLLLERNKEVATTHKPLYKLSEGRAAPHIIVVACCDGRCHPSSFLDLQVGEVIVMRTAAGRVSPVMNDIIALDSFLGMTDIMIIHHTDCGATYFTDEGIRATLMKRLPDVKGIETMKFGAYKDIKKSLKDDIETVRASPLVRKELGERTHGFIYNVDTGKLERVDV